MTNSKSANRGIFNAENVKDNPVPNYFHIGETIWELKVHRLSKG